MPQQIMGLQNEILNLLTMKDILISDLTNSCLLKDMVSLYSKFRVPLSAQNSNFAFEIFSLPVVVCCRDEKNSFYYSNKRLYPSYSVNRFLLIVVERRPLNRLCANCIRFKFCSLQKYYYPPFVQANFPFKSRAFGAVVKHVVMQSTINARRRYRRPKEAISWS